MYEGPAVAFMPQGLEGSWSGPEASCRLTPNPLTRSRLNGYQPPLVYGGDALADLMWLASLPGCRMQRHVTAETLSSTDQLQGVLNAAARLLRPRVKFIRRNQAIDYCLSQTNIVTSVSRAHVTNDTPLTKTTAVYYTPKKSSSSKTIYSGPAVLMDDKQGIQIFFQAND